MKGPTRVTTGSLSKTPTILVIAELLEKRGVEYDGLKLKKLVQKLTYAELKEMHSYCTEWILEGLQEPRGMPEIIAASEMMLQELSRRGTPWQAVKRMRAEKRSWADVHSTMDREFDMVFDSPDALRMWHKRHPENKSEQ